MECPKCGTECWNNTKRVEEGWKGPLFKCKDKDCGWVQWPERQKKQGKDAPIPRGPKWTWGSLSSTYARSLALAQKHLANVKGATPADVVAAATTLFIAVSRDGVAPLEKEQPPVTREELEREDDESGLPF